jgi:hypothetical protein
MHNRNAMKESLSIRMSVVVYECVQCSSPMKDALKRPDAINTKTN